MFKLAFALLGIALVLGVFVIILENMQNRNKK